MAAPGWDRAQVLPGPGAAPGRPHPVQASAVALDGAGIVIVGPPGVGKSTLAMHLLSLGAALVGDDAVTLTGSAAGVRVGPPARAAADADTGPDPHTATAAAAIAGWSRPAASAFCGCRRRPRPRLCGLSSIWASPSRAGCRRVGWSLVSATGLN